MISTSAPVPPSHGGLNRTRIYGCMPLGWQTAPVLSCAWEVAARHAARAHHDTVPSLPPIHFPPAPPRTPIPLYPRPYPPTCQHMTRPMNPPQARSKVAVTASAGCGLNDVGGMDEPGRMTTRSAPPGDDRHGDSEPQSRNEQAVGGAQVCSESLRVGAGSGSGGRAAGDS